MSSLTILFLDIIRSIVFHSCHILRVHYTKDRLGMKDVFSTLNIKVLHDCQKNKMEACLRILESCHLK